MTEGQEKTKGALRA